MISTILIDNISNGRLKSEWGLAILIEENGKKILLDFGASSKFLSNAKILEKDLSDIDYAVLSHAHCDHGDGIPSFLEYNKKAKVYIQETSKENCYTRVAFLNKYEGLKKGTLEKYKDRIIPSKGHQEIMDGVHILSHLASHPEIGKQENMLFKTENGYVYDDLLHEQSLIVETKEGLVIFSPCSHIGADAIINEVQETFKDKKICAIIGGFHLFNKSKNYVISFAKRLKDLNIDYIYTGHCTGLKAYYIMEPILGNKLKKLESGLVIEIGE